MTPQIMDLSFAISHVARPFALVAPGFEQVSRRDVRRAGLERTAAVPVAPFVAVELQIAVLPGSGVVAGLATATGDHVLAGYDPVAGRVTIEVRRGGRSTVVATAPATLRAPFGFAFVLCENRVTVVVDTGSGWQPLLTERDAVARLVDLRDPGTLSAHTLAYGSGGGDEIALRAVRAGPFGYTGVRDPHLVQRPDGSPLIHAGKAYLTLTCAGMGFFQQAHWGVFRLDLADPGRLEQVAQLYARRDGLVLGDHAGQLVVDEQRGATIAVVSSWGDFAFAGVHVRHTSTGADLLSGVHVVETEPLALPTTESAWDPSLTRIDDRWHVAFVESPSQDPFTFHPALAVGEPGGRYDEGLHLAGVDREPWECEGPIIQRLGDTWYVLASNRDDAQFPVYDLSMRKLGVLDAPYGSNIPHPQVVPLLDGGHLMVTFNGEQYAADVLGYGGHGDLVVMSAADPPSPGTESTLVLPQRRKCRFARAWRG